jgi:hypothetical protein
MQVCKTKLFGVHGIKLGGKKRLNFAPRTSTKTVTAEEIGPLLIN